MAFTYENILRRLIFMRISRRFMALALTLCLALTMIPGMAMAEGFTVADAAGLTNAINAAAGETTITLTADITTASALTINNNKDIILDLGGKTLTGTITLYSGNLTIKNGTVSLPGGQPLNVMPLATNTSAPITKLTVADNAKIIGAYGICLFGNGNKAYNAQIDVYGTIKAERSAVFVSGNIYDGNSVVNIHSGANLTGGLGGTEDRVGVAVNGYATVNIKDGANVQGPTAVEVRAGNLNITGGTFTATDDSFSAGPNNNGTTTTGAAVAVSSYNNSNIVVDISGGTFKGATAFGEIYTKEGEPEPEKVKISITGGDFTGAVSNEFEKGFISGGTFSTEPADELVAPNKGVISEGNKFVLVDASSVGGIKIYPAVLDFGTVKVGYTQPAPQTVYIESENGGRFKLEASGDGYIINGNDNSNEITVGDNGIAMFTVQPKAGLGAGVYDVTINVINVFEIVPSPSDASYTSDAAAQFIGLFFNRALASTADHPGITVKFKVDPASSGSGISVKYTGGNGFSSSKPDVPTGVEIDGVPVSFTGDGRNFTVSCIKPDSRWITVRWNSTSVTTNFTPDAAAYCSPTNIPKTGDASLAAFVVMAIAAAAGAMRRK
ncbi:MAG: hypothetical protein ACI4NL_05445 [Christensenellales bacterium]